MLDHRIDPVATLLTCCACVCLLGCPDDSPDAMSDSGSTMADTMAGESGADDDSSTGEPSPFDEAEVISMAGDYATALTKINVDAFASQHGLADTVNVYVSPDAAELYRSIDPEDPGEADFAEGTLIVKEHLDGEGAFDGYLLMYRGPDGYDPDAGDWFWARVDGSGATQETGAVGFCIGCHQPSPSFVFGVPADNQL